MTSMLHPFSDATDFDLRRQIAELEMVTSSSSAAKTLAENYVGLPLTQCRPARPRPQCN
jgi:p-hydroxybenzoate 3-monooxygenase